MNNATNSPNCEYTDLPIEVTKHCTYDKVSRIITLWDESGDGAVCTSIYPEVIASAFKVYIDFYLTV